MAKTCTLTSLAQFRTHAPQSLTIKLGEIPMLGVRKEFNTGSLGWYVNGKVSIQLAGGIKPMVLTIAGMPLIAEARAAGNPFSSGKQGWHANGKVQVQLADGTQHTCQVGANLTIINSDENPPQANDLVEVQVGINITVVGSKELPKVAAMKHAEPEEGDAGETGETKPVAKKPIKSAKGGKGKKTA